MAKPIPVPLLTEEEFNLVVNSQQTEGQKEFLKQSQGAYAKMSKKSKP